MMLDENATTISDTLKRPTYFTVQAKRFHVNAFKLTNQTMTAYCEAHGIPLSTFSTWVKKYGKKQSSGFVPVQVQREKPSPPTSKKQKPTQNVEIHRGDLKVVLPEVKDAPTAVEIIKGVLICN